MKRNLFTHNDLDGIISAALIKYGFSVERIFFSAPSSIMHSQQQITENDIVCDLPCPINCGYWFDHHRGNLEDLKLRGISPINIPGKFSEAPSCASVIAEYFKENNINYPDFFIETIKEINIIDSFDYKNIEEWRKPTYGKIIDCALKDPVMPLFEKDNLMQKAINLIYKFSLQEVSQNADFQKHYNVYLKEEEKMIQIIQQSVSFLEKDKNKDFVIIDLCHLKHPPKIQKNLAFLIYPTAKYVISIQNLFRANKKTNDLSLSISTSIIENQNPQKQDLGEIMRILNIGDGHIGAASGRIKCASKNVMEKEKKRLLEDIYNIWNKL